MAAVPTTVPLEHIHAIFEIPESYTIPTQELARYQAYVREERYPVFTRVMDCDTTVDCDCYFCKHASLMEDNYSGFAACELLDRN